MSEHINEVILTRGENEQDSGNAMPAEVASLSAWKKDERLDCLDKAVQICMVNPLLDVIETAKKMEAYLTSP